MQVDGFDTLYIAEKPSLAEAIATVLPGKPVKQRTHIQVGNIVLTWCAGHLLQQCAPEAYDSRYSTWSFDHLPIVPQQWKKESRPGASAQLAAIKSLLAKAQRVVHAGDPDQEGQLIVDEVLRLFGNTKPVSRILIRDYNPTKVREALASIKPNTDPLFVGWQHWAQCRSNIDWLIGMNMSRACTLRARLDGYNGVLSVGRVQTPTLAIVVARDEAIESFKPIPFFSLVATVRAAETTFRASWKPKASQQGLDDDKRLVDPALAAQLSARLSQAPVRVTRFVESTNFAKPPLPFSIKTLQMKANDAFGYSAAQTLETAQSLYETHKVTTYPRSDSEYLSDAQHAESPARLRAVAANLPALASAVSRADHTQKSAAFNDAKVTAHHGIVPTDRALPNPANLSERERNVYQLIATAFIAQFYPAHEYVSTVLTLDVGGEEFAARGKRTVAPGWTSLQAGPDAADSDSDSESDDEAQFLPRVTEGQLLENRGVTSLAKKTTAPPRFTEKTLLHAMGSAHQYTDNPVAKARLKEGQGIGTPATTAGIIEELKRRQYLLVKGKALISTSVARTLIHALPAASKDPGFTGLTEQTLDLVAEGKITPAAFMSRTTELISDLVKQAVSTKMNVTVHSCPTCKVGRLQRIKKKGGTTYFWGCNRYAEATNPCKAAFDDNKGEPLLSKPSTKAKKRSASSSKSSTKKGAAAKKTPAGGAKKTARSKAGHSVSKRGPGVER